MAANLNQVLNSTLFLALIFLSFLGSTRPDDSGCPYPCYPPPTGLGSSTPTTPAITLPPPPPSQVVSYPPPTGYNPTPAGYLPNYSPPAPPYGTSYGSRPPPPDPILPYFPFYYKKPLHRTDDSSATTTLGRSVILIATANLLLLFVSIHVF